MLLLHGNRQDHHIFDELTEKLQKDFTIYAIDSRNHGQSGRNPDFSYSAMMQDICFFIDSLKLGQVFITGFSDGAIITLLLALAYPSVIKKMALLGINLKPSDFNERSLNYMRSKYAETKDPLFNLMLTQPNIELEEVRKVNIPTLLIAAERELCKTEFYEGLAEAIPDAQLKIMQGHKHETYVVGQDILYPDLLSFFKQK